MKAMHGVMLAGALLAACSKQEPAVEKLGDYGKDELAVSNQKEAATKPAYRSEQGRYSVGTVEGTLEEKDIPDPQGVVWASASWSTKKTMYSTQYADFASPEAALAEMRAFRMTNNPSEMARDEEKQFQGRPGREMVMKTSSGMEVTMRFIVDGSRVYKAMGGTKVEQDNVAAFIDSMKIDGAAPAAAAVEPAAAPSGESEALTIGREVVAIYKEVSALGASTKGDCATFNTKIDPIRDRLWDLGKRHPGVLKELSNAELKMIGAADAQEEAGTYLLACKDSPHAMEFAFAMGKVLKATPEERAAAQAPPATTTAAAPATKAVKRPASAKASGPSAFEKERAKVLQDYNAKQKARQAENSY